VNNIFDLQPKYYCYYNYLSRSDVNVYHRYLHFLSELMISEDHQDSSTYMFICVLVYILICYPLSIDKLS